MKLPTNVTEKEAWIALFLTAGEFYAAFYLLVSEGHILALYLAITYAVRENPKAHHYHQIFVDLVKGTVSHIRRKK
jgi:hypothetical protein